MYWKSEIDFQRFEGFTSREKTVSERGAFFSFFFLNDGIDYLFIR